MPAFEARDGQREMAVAVARAIAGKEKLIVEAGTGIGKSLAYLLPAALMVAGQGGKAVISTNTLNLQEQLLNKDFSTVREIVKRETGVELDAAQLKGRSNYLCVQRWRDAVSQPNHNQSEARVLIAVSELARRYEDWRPLGVVVGMGHWDFQSDFGGRMSSDHSWWWLPVPRSAMFHA